MAFQRRRRHHHIISIPRLPPNCFIFGALLLSFSIFSFFFLLPLPADYRLPNLASSSQNNAIHYSTREALSFVVPNGGGKSGYDLWVSRDSEFFYGCSKPTSGYTRGDKATVRGRYLVIVTSGGLNQQRTGIVDAVAAARILNATLVVPQLDQRSYWKDSSNFEDIFNIDKYISYLSTDVKIIKQLPKNAPKPYTMRVPRKCSDRCYVKRVLPALNKRHVVRLTKFDYRVANKLPTDLQKLRCRVNYHALKFSDPIIEMGKVLVQRMRMKSKEYIALHLRFEADMLAFSGCYYGGGDKERKELGVIRKRWKGLHQNPDKARRHGKCLLTPEEVGLMLRALGYGRQVHLYVASGDVYGGEATLAPLKSLFPNIHSKDTIASKELKAFAKFSSRMAALDFIVCDESNVFVTNNNGNMAKILAGRRRYFGHKPTIRPNSKKLNRLFADRDNMTWGEFAAKVSFFQRGFMGNPKELRAGRGEFHENPSTCICEDSDARARSTSNVSSREGVKAKPSPRSDSEDDEESDNVEDDREWIDPDYNADNDLANERRTFNESELDYNSGLATDEPELEDMVSD